ncbi:hypothetical protein ACFV2N_47300 [Streptomyces sp. NPDC059680]|uniref:hypothetical protein n=1 Tax=Streptomyces sp. NPDC059680 TaxID=3346904 RepID=UPI0036C2679E
MSTDVAPPVTEGLVVRSAALREGGETSAGRRLRYTQTSDPGPDVFAGERKRPPASARRRHRGDRQP